MSRVCALNNYPLLKMWARAEAGATPRQHLWGIDALSRAGHTVTCAPFHEPGASLPAVRLTRWSRGVLGHLDQEAYALRHLSRYDTLYCADQFGLGGLALARTALPDDVALVSVVHHPAGHSLRRGALARHDVLIGLSERVCDELSLLAGSRHPVIRQLPWGPDLEWGLYRNAGESNGVVSAGKSNRDVATLVDALRSCAGTGLVYDFATRPSAQPSTRIRVVRPGVAPGLDPGAGGAYTTERVIGDLAAASIVAIPVDNPDRLTGLTEAVDALALGKPIVATRSPYFPFDIEAVGCGVWVAPGDRDGWASALRGLLADEDRRRAMGAAGRHFAEASFNYAAFSDGLLSALALRAT